MKQLLELIPLATFFILFKLYDIFIGVSGLMIASTLTLMLTWIIYRKIEKINLFSYVMVLIFGVMTLYFHNAEFIKWKVTIVYLIFSVVLFVSHFASSKPVLQKMLSKEVKLDNKTWKNINLIWCAFFLICAITNLYIAYFTSENTWAIFKVFILPITTIIFTILSIIYIYKKQLKH